MVKLYLTQCHSYHNNVKLTGLLYLHRISDVRLAGTPLRSLAVFKDLCGDDNLKNIILVTTMWDEVDSQSVGCKREEELLSSFWKDMILLGSRTCRFLGTHESAWEIINRLDLEGSRQGRAPLQIQREMVDRGLPFHETTAAKTLLRSLVQLAREYKRVWAKLHNKARRTTNPREPSGGLRRHTFQTGPPTGGSSASDDSSMTLISSNSTLLPIPAGSTPSGCSANGRRDTLLATIRVLKLAHQMADIGHVPMLRGVIGSVLHIAQLIEVSTPLLASRRDS